MSLTKDMFPGFQIDYIKWVCERLTEKQIKAKRLPKYYKPPVLETIGTHPFRCRICNTKYLYEEHAEKCIEECFITFPDKVWKYIEEQNKKPEEISSWQWDLDTERKAWAGVVYYSNGNIKYFKTNKNTRIVDFISIQDLIKLLEKECYVMQESKLELPEELKRFLKKRIKHVAKGRNFRSTIIKTREQEVIITDYIKKEND